MLLLLLLPVSRAPIAHPPAWVRHPLGFCCWVPIPPHPAAALKSKFAVTSVAGRVFAWGMGTNYQLGTGEEDDVWSPVEMTGKQLENRTVLAVSSGGQHTVLLVKDKEQS